MREQRYPVEGEALLLEFLLAHVKGKSRNSVKSLLTRRQVAVDGQVVTRHDHTLAPGQVVTVAPPTPPGARLPFPILYEDGEILVVDKPAGLLSMASERERLRTAYRMANEYVALKSPGSRVFIVHRLDRDTSGVLLFAKSEAAKHAWQDRWNELVTRRGYVAVVEGAPEQDSGTVKSRLKETSTHLVYSAGPDQGGGKAAVTRYTVKARGDRYSLLEVDIDTGRKNQIRVHLSDLGHPVAGDRQYGAATSPLGRLCLHAHVLELRHPVTGAPIRFEAPIPPGFLKLAGR